MKCETFFMPDAIKHFEDACAWYEKQSDGLRDAFCDELEKVINRIEANPEGFAIEHKSFRSLLVNRFPYLLIYLVRGDRIEIHAVFHTHRDLDAWKSRH